MPRTHAPRAGSMQFWPRKRAKREYARVRSWAKLPGTKLLGFAGYKAGMTHLLITDNKKTTLTKGEDIFCPVTIIECPPLKSASIRFYKKTIKGSQAIAQFFASDLNKELKRRINLPKTRNTKGLENSNNSQDKESKKIEDIKEFDDITLLVHTQPGLTGIGKKKPEIFEIAISGNKEEKLKFAKEQLGKEIRAKDVFKEGDQIDIHAITRGKGFQGPVKRFGVSIRNHKSEKTIRGPGSLGAWCGQGHIMYRVAHAGKMGYHQRTEYNKWLLKLGEKPEEINSKGGFINFGAVKNNYVLVKGSVAGPKKRLIRFNHAIRPNHKIPAAAPTIQYTSLKSKQGN